MNKSLCFAPNANKGHFCSSDGLKRGRNDSASMYAAIFAAVWASARMTFVCEIDSIWDELRRPSSALRLKPTTQHRNLLITYPASPHLL